MLILLTDDVWYCTFFLETASWRFKNFFFTTKIKISGSWSENLLHFFLKWPSWDHQRREGDSCLKQRKKAFLIPFTGREGDGVFNAYRWCTLSNQCATANTRGKPAKAIKWGKEVFQQMFLEKLDIPMQRMKLKPYPPPYRKVDSKWTKSLNIRMSITKLSEENRGKKGFFKDKKH